MAPKATSKLISRMEQTYARRQSMLRIYVEMENADRNADRKRR